MSEFLTVMEKKLPELDAGADVLIVSHLGDGNIHFNVCPPSNYDPDTFKQNTEEIREIVYGNANSFGGSFAAEHGVGQIKKKQMLNYKDEVELQLMKDLKNLLDPKNILNPGKIF